MASIHTYLTFNGDCEAAFNFYKAVFGGEFEYFGRFSDMPPSEDYVVPKADKNKIMHVALKIGSSLLMASDIGCNDETEFKAGNNFSVAYTADTKEDADKIFNALSVGGKITMPIQNTFWGDYFGMLTDKFGINWMVSFALTT